MIIYRNLWFCLALRWKDKKKGKIKLFYLFIEFKLFLQHEHLFPAGEDSIETVTALMCLEYAL